MGSNPFVMGIQAEMTRSRLNYSRAQRIVWLLEELGLKYSVELFQRKEDMTAPPELQKVHPLGKSPVVGLTFPDAADATKTKELVLVESGFIAQYLTDTFGQTSSLLPKRYRDGHEGQAGAETDEWMRYQYFLHYPEGSLMPPLLVGLILDSMYHFYFSIAIMLMLRCAHQS
jgi:glutathione S-transferase